MQARKGGVCHRGVVLMLRRKWVRLQSSHVLRGCNLLRYSLEVRVRRGEGVYGSREVV